VTTKVLKSARSCEVGDVHVAIDELVAGARPRAVAAQARKSIEDSSTGESLPMSTEAFSVRVLTRLHAEFPEAADRTAALRVLEAALQIEQKKDASNGTTSEAPPPRKDKAAAEEAPVDEKSSAPLKRPPMPDLSSTGRSKLMQADGDEANEMNRHAGGRGGGINCPCCNPDDPQFLVDKMLMM
jgi:hypothetical protein